MSAVLSAYHRTAIRQSALPPLPPGEGWGEGLRSILRVRKPSPARSPLATLSQQERVY